MTVEVQTEKVSAVSNGAATTFSFSPMVIYSSSEVVVTAVVDATGVETVLTEGTGAAAYAVTNTEYPSTGSIRYPEDEVTPVPAGTTFFMKRVLVLEQDINLSTQGGYDPRTLEQGLDKLVMMLLQQQETLDRAVVIPISDATTTITTLTAHIIALAAIESDITTVAGIAADVTTAANIAADISTVATNVADITNFSDVYLGPKAADPVIRNDGSALQAGDIYFNTVSNSMKHYNGAAWAAITSYVTATATVEGVVELATQAEVDTGTDTSRAVTPETLEGKLPNHDSIVVDGDGIVTVTTQPAFLATASLQSDVTGDGTNHTVLFATEVVDQNSDFASSTFTAPVTGVYVLFAAVQLEDCVSHPRANIQIVTSNRTYVPVQIDAGVCAENHSGLDALMVTGMAVADMDAGDTAVIKTNVLGGTKTVDVAATSYFCGHKLS